MTQNQTLRFTRRNLPHWEVISGRYFITVRCADSLPATAIEHLREIHSTIACITPNSDAFAILQRQYFLALEKHLDTGAGACPLRNPLCAQSIIDELLRLGDWRIAAPHFSVMPNHWHALLQFPEENPPALAIVLKRLKGRTALAIRRTIGGTGPVWQREWFDRWMRDDSQWTRCVNYIQNNPVKAGLVAEWTQHRWTR